MFSMQDFYEGKENAFNAIHKTFYQGVYKVAKSVFYRNKEMSLFDVEEAVSFAMIELYKKRERIVNIAHIRAFMFKVTKQHILSAKKKVKTHAPHKIRYARLTDVEIDGFWTVERKYDISNLREVIKLMPEPMKTLMWLKYVEDYSEDEITEKLNITRRKISEISARGRRILKQLTLLKQDKNLKDKVLHLLKMGHTTEYISNIYSIHFDTIALLKAITPSYSFDYSTDEGKLRFNEAIKRNNPERRKVLELLLQRKRPFEIAKEVGTDTSYVIKIRKSFCKKELAEFDFSKEPNPLFITETGKTKEQMAEEVIFLRSKGLSYEEISNKTGISQDKVGYIIRGGKKKKSA